MNKAHNPINWQNYPETKTPINAANLNKMDSAVGVIDDRVIQHESDIKQRIKTINGQTADANGNFELAIPKNVSELSNDAGYATTEQLDRVSEEKVDQVTFKQHTENGDIHVTANDKQAWNKVADKVDKTSITLGKHTDGLIYIFVDGQKVGNGVEVTGEVVEGDVIGTLDENNNVLLSGTLADGTYTLKWLNDDGTYSDVGDIVVGEIPEEPTGRLPKEYQEVEWVQIVNSENVDTLSAVHTNVKWNEINKIVVKYQSITSSNANDMIFCTWDSEANKTSPYIATRTSKASSMLGYQTGLTSYSVTPNNIAVTDLNANEYTINLSATATGDICFGGWHDADFTHPHKWYYVEFYSGETLVANFVPCYRKSDNTNGFYDLVGGAFYVNSDTKSIFINRGNNV